MSRLIRLKAAVVLIMTSFTFGVFAAYTNTGSSSTLTIEPSKPLESQNQNQDAAQPGLTKNISNSSSVGPSAMQLSDTALLASVQQALSSYKEKVKVTVSNRVVYLAGEVDSDTDYQQVVALAQSAPGGGEINADNLTVKGSQQPLTDTFLTAKVKGALIKAKLMGKDLPAWSVGVETKNGQVYLSGQVPSAKEKQAILDVVKSVQGVVKVNDKMAIAENNSGQKTI